MAHSRRSHILVIAFALVAALLIPALLPGPGAARASAPGAKSPAQALARDAQSYATDQGVSVEEATRRLQLQDAIGPLGAALEARERDTYAGLWIQHRPDYRVIALFTRDGAQTLRRYTAGGPLAGLVEARTAQLTLAQLENAQEAAVRLIRPLGVAVDARLNVSENRAEILVVERARLDAALGAAGLRLPDGAAAVTVSGLARPVADAYAGRDGNNCTSGFSVSGPEGKGMTTAAHCPNDQWQPNTGIFWATWSWYYGPNDLQWHAMPGQTMHSWAYDGLCCPTYTPITATRGRDSQQVGDYVCHYGKTTHYGCGYIVSKTYLGSAASPENTGPMDFTFIQVHRDGVTLAMGGDSGGPWFYGTTALGIMHASNDAGDGLYMAINYVQATGLTVLVNCPDSGC